MVKRTIKFKDKNNIKWTVTSEIREDGQFSMVGEGNMSLGQCLDQIVPKHIYQQDLVNIWNKYHLNLFNKVELSEDFEDSLNTLLDSIEEIESQEDVCSIEEVYEKNPEELENYDREIIVLGIYLNLDISEIDDIIHTGYGYNKCLYEVQGSEYYCGTVEDITIAVMEYIEDSLWAFNPSFLSNYGAFKSMHYADVETICKSLQDKCESSNDAIKALVNWHYNQEEITEDAISADGYGNYLNGYDGNYDEIELYNIRYIICRT
jgi:hypothetical protein